MKKAIKFFEEEITRLENAPKINGCEMTDEWAEQIEICKTAKSAIEKQIPKKPTPHIVNVERLKIGNARWGKGTTVYKCPCCNNFISRLYDYCFKCGQALDWSDTE